MNLPRHRERIISSSRIDENGCWIWQKHTHKNGYGRFGIGGGKVDGAHRVSFRAFVGTTPQGMDVCHKCDVRNCVNPDHLFLGTRSENILDASAKNRVSRTHQKRGSFHPSAKLSESSASEILARLSAGATKASLSREYGVSQRVILLISRGELWKHVARPPMEA